MRFLFDLNSFIRSFIHLLAAGFDFESSMAVTFATPSSPVWNGASAGGDLPPITSLSSTTSDSNNNNKNNNNDNSNNNNNNNNGSGDSNFTTIIRNDDILPPPIIMKEEDDEDIITTTSTNSNNNVDIVIAIPERDRAMSFELSAFVYKEEDEDEDEHPSSLSSYNNILIKMEEQQELDNNNNNNNNNTTTTMITTRPRGDSIIFDPVSFSDGGIHEENALLRSVLKRWLDNGERSNDNLFLVYGKYQTFNEPWGIITSRELRSSQKHQAVRNPVCGQLP